MYRNYSAFVKVLRTGLKSRMVDNRLQVFEADWLRRRRWCSSHGNDATAAHTKHHNKLKSAGDQLDAQTSSSVPQFSREIQEKFSVYRDEDSSVILDQLEEAQLREKEELSLEEDEELITPAEDPFYGLNLQRGVEGVFDVHVLVDVLRGEKARNICVVRIPKEMKYADYLVVVTGFSHRHLQAMAAFIKKLYKKKRGHSDPFVKVEGEDSKNWLVLDMGNIVLHLFLPEERAKYDLEALWSLGPEYDDLSQKKEDELMDKFEEHLRFLQNSKPQST